MNLPEAAKPEGFDRYRLSGPYVHANLAIYLCHLAGTSSENIGFVTLEEALRTGVVKVSEKSGGAEVNELQIENSGDRAVYLQAGDTVKGGQQDRTIAVDSILPARSGKKTIDAFCVEPGRWSERQVTAQAGGGPLAGAIFAPAEAPVATKEQKLAVRLERSQEKVWEAGRRVNEDLARESTLRGDRYGKVELIEPKNSYAEAIEDSNVTRLVNQAMASLENAAKDKADAVGAVFCVNGKVQNVEVYSSSGLFLRLWPKLLRAAAVEALAKQTKDGSPKPPSESDLRGLFASVSSEKGRVELRPGGPTIRVFEREHAVLFDTESDGRMLHRQILTK
jgi:hypothetical protein